MDYDPISREDSLAFSNGTKPLSELPDGVFAIHLTRGMFALVDLCDYERLVHYAWWARKGTHTYYADADPRGKPRGERISMHREILGSPEYAQVDHVNGNRLDNRRINLREATSQQNRRHEIVKRGGSSRFKGVCWNKERGKWQVGIGCDSRNINLGRYDSEEQAARVYDRAAVHLFGEFCELNFPNEFDLRMNEGPPLRALKRRSMCSSRFRGVCYDQSRSKWMSCFHSLNLGRFDSEEDAARAYDAAACCALGSSAVLNFPHEVLSTPAANQVGIRI